jgi:hypothetical protein
MKRDLLAYALIVLLNGGALCVIGFILRSLDRKLKALDEKLEAKLGPILVELQRRRGGGHRRKATAPVVGLEFTPEAKTAIYDYLREHPLMRDGDSIPMPPHLPPGPISQ